METIISIIALVVLAFFCVASVLNIIDDAKRVNK